MKGYFTIRRDPYTDEVSFGKLDSEMYGSGSFRDCMREGSRIPMVMAHDVVEHNVSHRTNTDVTYEGELQAIGAIAFVRQNDGYDVFDVCLNQVIDARRKIKPLAKIKVQHLYNIGELDADLMKLLFELEGCAENARNAMHHYCWGYVQKTKQFKGDAMVAREAFRFVEDAARSAMKELRYMDWSFGVTTYFDTELKIIRHTYKWS